MRNTISPASVGWLVVFGSVACMGATMAVAQRAGDPDRPAAAKRGQPGEERAPAGANTRSRADEAPANRRQPTDRRAAEQPQPTERRQATDRNDRIDPIDGRRDDVDGRQPRELAIKFQGQQDLIIGEIADGSLAAEAGFRPQDRIISVDGRPMTGQRRFHAYLSGIGGRRIPVVVERDGREHTIQLTSTSAADGPWLGVFLQDNQEENERGARVTHVFPAGPAARAGLRPGDVILKANDEEVQSAPDLISAIDGMKPQAKVNLRVLRGERELDAVAQLASRSSFIFHQAFRGGEDRAEDQGDPSWQDDDPYSGLPAYAMQLEHDRRMAEQHERLETELRKLQDEVRQLREAIQKK